MIHDVPFKIETARDFEFGGQKYKYAALLTGDVFDYLKFAKEKYPFFRDAEFNKVGKNKERFVYELFSDEDEWFKGGPAEDFYLNSAPIGPYKTAKKKFQASNIMKQVISTIGERPQRRRTRSEHDGEFDFDKRWDITPFTKSVKKDSPVKIIKLHVDLSFSCDVSVETITEYGMFIVFLIELLESQGILVELFVNKMGTGFLSNASGSSVYNISFKVKNPNQYVALPTLLKVFSGPFYRRMSFAAIIACAETLGHTVEVGLGSPYKRGKVWDMVDDTVHIYSVPNYEDQHKIVEKLLELLNQVVK